MAAGGSIATPEQLKILYVFFSVLFFSVPFFSNVTVFSSSIYSIFCLGW